MKAQKVLLATDLNLKGYVRNLGNVVEIIIEGKNTESFIERLPNELPPIAKIDSMIIEDIESKNYPDFEINALKKLEIQKTDDINIRLMHVLIADPDLQLLKAFPMIE